MDVPAASEVRQGEFDPGWETPPRRPPDANAAPLLSVDGFEGPLDWLLEMARAQRIDVSKLSILALVDSFEAALHSALAWSGATSATLGRWGDWLVMAADLALLRSRLLVAADTADSGDAVDDAEALRQGLVRRAEIGAAANWLDRREQLGRDVFARGRADHTRPVRGGHNGDVTALLRACLVALRLPADAADRYRVPAAPFWTVGEAIERIMRLLPGFGEAGGELAAFLPAVPADVPDRDQRCRVAVASTFLGGLELARDGAVRLGQHQAFQPIALGRGIDARAD